MRHSRLDSTRARTSTRRISYDFAHTPDSSNTNMTTSTTTKKGTGHTNTLFPPQACPFIFK